MHWRQSWKNKRRKEKRERKRIKWMRYAGILKLQIPFEFRLCWACGQLFRRGWFEGVTKTHTLHPYLLLISDDSFNFSSSHASRYTTIASFYTQVIIWPFLFREISLIHFSHSHISIYDIQNPFLKLIFDLRASTSGGYVWEDARSDGTDDDEEEEGTIWITSIPAQSFHNQKLLMIHRKQLCVCGSCGVTSEFIDLSELVRSRLDWLLVSIDMSTISAKVAGILCSVTCCQCLEWNTVGRGYGKGRDYLGGYLYQSLHVHCLETGDNDPVGAWSIILMKNVS